MMPATVVLGQLLWQDTTQPPRPAWGVAVEGGRVVAVASNSDLRARFPAATVVDAGDCAITPAFVNAHHHMYGVLAHGIPLAEAPSGFWPFLEQFWWPRVEDRLTHDLIAAATDWACLEMIHSGVTTFYDCLEAPYALPGALEVEADVVRRRGLRGVLSFEATERVGAENLERGLRENADFIDRCRARGGLVSGMMCFHTTFTCSPGAIERACRLASARKARVHMHLSEGAYEPEYCLERFGVRPVVHYDRLGVLGSHVLASQCVQVDAGEIALLAQRGVHVSHQPLSNCEVGAGLAPVPEMLGAGINVALGTDGYVPGFFEVMRAAALVPRARLQDPRTMPAGAVWTMATRNGARALGFDDLGTLTPGDQADLLLISADLPTPLNEHNLAEQLLLWRNPADIRGVMCAGRWLMRDGKITGTDEEAVRARVAEAARHLWQREGTLGRSGC
ncbi:MAG: amidohydrolase family protein [Anaerolineae bacterium]|nr:amidohydrolase family protein [Anaerolineae bacterium]